MPSTPRKRRKIAGMKKYIHQLNRFDTLVPTVTWDSLCKYIPEEKKNDVETVLQDGVESAEVFVLNSELVQKLYLGHTLGEASVELIELVMKAADEVSNI